MIYMLMGIGGTLGALLRYSLGQWVGTGGSSLFPFGTLAVNFAGCFVLAFFLRRRRPGSSSIRISVLRSEPGLSAPSRRSPPFPGK